MMSLNLGKKLAVSSLLNSNGIIQCKESNIQIWIILLVAFLGNS